MKVYQIRQEIQFAEFDRPQGKTFDDEFPFLYAHVEFWLQRQVSLLIGVEVNFIPFKPLFGFKTTNQAKQVFILNVNIEDEANMSSTFSVEIFDAFNTSHELFAMQRVMRQRPLWLKAPMFFGVSFTHEVTSSNIQTDREEVTSTTETPETSTKTPITKIDSKPKVESGLEKLLPDHPLYQEAIRLQESKGFSPNQIRELTNLGDWVSSAFGRRTAVTKRNLLKLIDTLISIDLGEKTKLPIFRGSYLGKGDEYYDSVREKALKHISPLRKLSILSGVSKSVLHGFSKGENVSETTLKKIEKALEESNLLTEGQKPAEVIEEPRKEEVGKVVSEEIVPEEIEELREKFDMISLNSTYVSNITGIPLLTIVKIKESTDIPEGELIIYHQKTDVVLEGIKEGRIRSSSVSKSPVVENKTATFPQFDIGVEDSLMSKTNLIKNAKDKLNKLSSLSLTDISVRTQIPKCDLNAIQLQNVHLLNQTTLEDINRRLAALLNRYGKEVTERVFLQKDTQTLLVKNKIRDLRIENTDLIRILGISQSNSLLVVGFDYKYPNALFNVNSLHRVELSDVETFNQKLKAHVDNLTKPKTSVIQPGKELPMVKEQPSLPLKEEPKQEEIIPPALAPSQPAVVVTPKPEMVEKPEPVKVVKSLTELKKLENFKLESVHPQTGIRIPKFNEKDYNKRAKEVFKKFYHGVHNPLAAVRNDLFKKNKQRLMVFSKNEMEISKLTGIHYNDLKRFANIGNPPSMNSMIMTDLYLTDIKETLEAIEKAME